jgi:MFS transporter, NNP family, nitrate/nitrite transporter
MSLFLVLVGCLFLFARESRRHEREHLLHPGI